MNNTAPKNLLDCIPKRNIENFSIDEKGIVTLEIENTGVFNRIAQKLFKKPKITFIHLDEFGSFIWPLIDGETDISKLGEKVKEHFGEECEPLYPRLTKFIQILENYKFINLK